MKFGEGMKIIQEQYPDYVIMTKNGIENAILLNQEFELLKFVLTKRFVKWEFQNKK